MMDRIASRKYVNGSRGQPCSFRIVGVCTGGGEDTVFAHIRDRHTGRSIKAGDISGADSCFACHEVFDGRVRRRGEHMMEMEWLFYALRGLQETLENRIERGLLLVVQDAAPRVKSITVTELKDGRLVHHEGKMAAKKPGRRLNGGHKLESRPTVWPSRPLRTKEQP